MLTKFRADEQTNENEKQNVESERQCKAHFVETYQHDPNDGRFIVQLSFKQEVNIGDSHQMALTRLKKLEQRFKQNSNFFQQYKDAMREYINSGVLEKIPVEELECGYLYYLPHSGYCSPVPPNQLPV